MKQNSSLSSEQLQELARQQWWGQQEGQPRSLLVDRVGAISIYELELAGRHCLVPIEGSQLAWSSGDFLAMCGLAESASPLGAGSTHPVFRVGDEVAKFYPWLNSEGLARERSALRQLGGVLAPHYVRDIVLRGECVGFVQQYCEGTEAWTLCVQRGYGPEIVGKIGEALNRMQGLLTMCGVMPPSPFASLRQWLAVQAISVPEDWWPSTSAPAHMDMHLGQCLLVGGSVRLLDFGACPHPNVWWACEHPVMDFAGILRSLDYAETVAGRLPLDEHRYRMAAQWLGWGGGMGCLALATLARCLYEIEYERAHRPDWAWLPERAVEHILRWLRLELS